MALVKSVPSAAAPSPPPSAALDDPDPQRRREALRAHVADPAAWPAIAGRLPQEQDTHVRSVLVTCLVETQSVTAARALASELGSEDVGLRNLALQALAEMPEPALAVLPATLRSPDADVRIFAAMVLGSIGGDQACALLCELLEHDGQVNVVDAAINGLAEIGGAQHIPALKATRRRFASDPYIGFAAGAAIQALQRTPSSA